MEIAVRKMERIDKILSNYGGVSRAEAKVLLKAGKEPAAAGAQN